ncbi:MAG: aspartate aminotransferase [Candidatus Atribacteria bacterium]|nr:aspartate aminotransferase [Candidatus Atribacteria bacterium]
MISVPQQIATLPRSGIRELMSLALATPGVIRLEMGEPHFPTPAAILNQLQDFYSQGEIKYTPTVGISSLRSKFADKLKRERGWSISSEQIIALPGSLFGTVTVFRTLLEPGDEVLVPDPGFTNHFSQVVLCGGVPKPYFLLPENDFLPDLSEIKSAITSKTKIILVNTPSNPVGVIFPPSVLEEIGKMAEEFDLLVIADEAYEKFIYQGEYHGLYDFVSPERLISTFSFSKTYALSGWRIGCMVSPRELVMPLAKVAEYIIACSSHLSQKAAEVALDLPEEEVNNMVEYYRQNALLASRELEQAGFSFFPPQGGYYVWVDIREFGRPSLDFCKDFLQSEKVALAPGSAFGQKGEGFVRLSICRQREEVKEGISRLARFRKEQRK